MLNALSAAVPESDRIITIEDAAELQLNQQHVLRLESRPKNIEGEGEVGIRELVRNSLRMRPDRIIVGEVRGAEALDMLQAMNTGHEGSLCTVHANSPRDALARIETMVLMSGFDLPLRAIRQQVASALDMIVHLERLEDGSRRVVAITEVQRMESEVITLQELFEFKIERVLEDRTVIGELESTGLRPSFMHKFEKRGHDAADVCDHHTARGAGRGRTAVKRLLVIVGLAAAGLLLAVAAANAAGEAQLVEIGRVRFPDRGYLVNLPPGTSLHRKNVQVRENGRLSATVLTRSARGGAGDVRHDPRARREQ